MKQRLIGAAVLVALAVIFLPMLVQGPAPDSGVSDLPLQMPDAPGGEYETRDLPLVAPRASGTDGLLDNDDALPTVDTATAPPASEASPIDEDPAATPTELPAEQPGAASEMLPATTAGGNYAVSFGAYGNRANADSVVNSLRQSQLSGYRETATIGGKSAWRVRIGPYATRAEAEAARLRAAHVRDDVDARVVALDVEAAQARPAATPSRTVAQTPAPKPVEPGPAAAEAPQPVAATAGVGFAVQLGAFSKPADATALRDRVRAAGINAFTDTVDTEKGALTRVKAGPVLSRAEAERLKAQVQAKFGIDGLVRSHP